MTIRIPAEQAALDQAWAGVNRDLDNLVNGIRGQVAEHGDDQAMANVAMLVTKYTTSDQNESMLVAALMRLARMSPEGEPKT